MRRVVLAGVVTLMVVLATAAPAAAGGSTWEFDDDPYAPGDTVFGWAQVAWAHNGGLGTPADGPYLAHLRRITDDEVVDYSDGLIPDDAVLVAEIVTSEDPYESGGVKWGPHSATVEFVLPDVAPGQYEVLHCNDPCTTTLGDITWGAFTVVAGDPTAVVPTTVPAATTTTAPARTEATPTTATDDPLVAVGATAVATAQLAPAPDREQTSDGALLWPIAAGGVLVVALGAVVVRRRRTN